MRLGKYNQSKTITFDLVAPDGIDLIVNATFAAGDLVIMKDEGAEANTTNLPTDEGTGYSLVLTATEMTAARVRIYIIDQTATKVWLDVSVSVDTYGNASAEHAFDLDTALVTLAAATHTGAVIPTVTTLTNLPAITTNWLTAVGIAAGALDGKGDWNIGKTGYALVSTGLDAIASTATGMVEIAKAVWDRVLTGATHNIATSAGRRLRGIQDFQGYENGAIWIDTINGTAGTTDYENGTVENPVDSIANANTLAASLGIPRFEVAPGSTITLAATQSNESFHGNEWTLALGGQNIAGTLFHGAVVSGIATGANANFMNCEIGTVTVADCRMNLCRWAGTITLSTAGDYYFYDCISAIAGASTPIIDFGTVLLVQNLNIRRYSGGIQIDNKDNAGTDQMSLEGNGQLIVSASSGGAISVRGNFKVTNTGGATITYDDNTTNTAAILVDTNELQTDWTDGGRLDLILDIIAQDTSIDIPALIAALNDISAADVLTQVNAALDTAIAELGVAVPSATPTLRTGLMLMYMALRNKTVVQTSGTDALEINNNAGTIITKKLLTDDGSDLTEAQMS